MATNYIELSEDGLQAVFEIGALSRDIKAKNTTGEAVDIGQLAATLYDAMKTAMQQQADPTKEATFGAGIQQAFSVFQ